MALTCSIQSRRTCIALVASSITTLAAVAALVAVTISRSRCECAVQAAPVIVSPVIGTGPAIQYASSVRAFSSEYSSSSWSAMQALGAPDVYPRSGDDGRAWASRDEDAPTEFVELGFAQPQRASAAIVYETFNPGAVTHVELITKSGARIVVPRSGLAHSGSAAASTFATSCTTEPIVGLKFVVASGNVAGWNEIDAVGLLPCQ